MITSQSKRFLKKAIRQCGYEVTRITRSGLSQTFPYVRSYRMGDCEFQFWIASLSDARITVGDTLIYVIAGFVVLVIARAIRALARKRAENRRKAWRRQYGDY